ncbi:DUF4097 domain-containing protein [Skermania sp. ID1734]|uniref:DUF4097 family beta strand repeat-containing protein n=1 Tax=Skermania sp. ID1734 TaxID=2597516 RepID=UPI00117C4B2A|nr:DUF4097 family beta strand repeat-containing protein [Skermania sp. ID1734]TSE00972.1 DUF4097 domain-containing protein [Skermania sp. ID1734]
MTTYTLPVSGPISLACRLGYGALTVHARDDVTEATVTLSSRHPDSAAEAMVTVDMRGTTLTVEEQQPRFGLADIAALIGGRRDALDVEVTVPTGTPVRISTRGSQITLTGTVGTADIVTGAADLIFETVDGDLRFRSGSGQARGTEVTGDVSVKTGSGRARIDQIRGGVEVRCGSGSLDIGVARGPVNMRTGSGTASIECAEGDIDFVSGSGGMSIGLPAGQTARLDVLTGNGRVHSELPVEDTPPTGKAVIDIRARTGNGNVRLHRSTRQPV